ncbi:hypothetical protein [Paracoccus fontiphilus]|uniref:Uncharacterized protein n=1 Tax=Paracoccus fontiphilus TaxID=1815556 RepID=A0ABV7IME0_9RHOB|nr:hypothetical protein [Paracoccus fontiphilus]
MTNLPTKTNLLATTKLACEIANINPDRFNESIHSNFYPCAPKTSPGKARSFNVDDIVALRLYQRSISAGMSAAAAGTKACKVREFMQTSPDASRVYIVATDFEVVDYLLPDWDVTQTKIMINATQAIDVIGCEVIDLDWHRVRVVHYITEADKHRVVGD